MRKARKIKLPDAIICATAISENADLLTNDSRLKRVKRTMKNNSKLNIDNCPTKIPLGTTWQSFKIAIAGTGCVGLSNRILLLQHNEVVALEIIPEKGLKNKEVMNDK